MNPENSDKPYFAHGSASIDGETSANGFCDPNIGAGTRIWHQSHVMAGARIGRNCNLGQNIFVGGTVVIGDNCKVQNNVNIYNGVTLGDSVFCGPSMTFTNLSEPLPRAAITRHDFYQPTGVGNHVSFGAGAVIVCGHELGDACFVAAGAVVNMDVPSYALVAGVPARIIGWVCQCGARLKFEDDRAHCDAVNRLDGMEVPCGLSYRMIGPERIEML